MVYYHSDLNGLILMTEAPEGLKTIALTPQVGALCEVRGRRGPPQDPLLQLLVEGRA